MLDSILAGLEESFGFSHSMILVPAEEEGVLVTIATRGYAENGAGAEARHGEGIIGLVAEARKPIRISGLLREMLYAYAVHKHAQEQGLGPPERQIPLPGLPRPESQLGVPLLVRGELVGVLCIESEVPYRFHEEDKASVELLGSYLAIAIQNMQLQERAGDPVVEPRTCESPAPDDEGPVALANGLRRTPRCRLLRGGRVHPRGWRVPDPQPPCQNSVEAPHVAGGDRAAGSSPTASCAWTSR